MPVVLASNFQSHQGGLTALGSAVYQPILKSSQHSGGGAEVLNDGSTAGLDRTSGAELVSE